MLIEKSSYKNPPRLQFNGHLQTIMPAFRKIEGVQYERIRIETADDDFFDLDVLFKGNKNLMILCHGLEGNSARPYIQSMAKYFHDKKWDIIAWNCRSCSGEMNRQFKMYSHGDTEDLALIIEKYQDQFDQIVLVGFSMGGNILLKYLGVNAEKMSKKVKGGIAFSAPIQLRDSAITLDKRLNFLYKRKFLRQLKTKILQKNNDFPGLLDITKLENIRKWEDFDHHFSAKLCGFNSAKEFYTYGSAINFIEPIRIPTLIVNAINDPILSNECYPYNLLKNHPFIALETPKEGGHVGYMLQGKTENTWMELRTESYLKSIGIIE
jgi:uncharacterized protein